jgi:hypothetical protein
MVPMGLHAKPLVALPLAVATVAVAGCFGSGRSVAAVCHVWDTDGKALHTQLEDEAASASDNPLGTLANLAAAPERVANLMGKLAGVAPTNVEPAFAHLAAAFHQIALSAGASGGDPLVAFASSLGTGLAVQADVEVVNRFLADNCGIPH